MDSELSPKKSPLKRAEKDRYISPSKQHGFGFFSDVSDLPPNVSLSPQSKISSTDLIVRSNSLDAPDINIDFSSNYVDFCVDGTLAVVLGTDVYTWNNGFTRKIFQSTSLIDSIRWIARSLVISYDGCIVLVDADMLDERFLFSTESERAVGIACFGDEIAVGDSNGYLTLYNIIAGFKSKRKFHSLGISRVEFSNDGILLATGSDDGTVAISGKDHFSKYQFKSQVNALAWGKGRRVYVGLGQTSQVCCINVSRGEVTKVFNTYYGISAMTFLPDFGLMFSTNNQSERWYLTTPDLSVLFRHNCDGTIFGMTSHPELNCMAAITTSEKVIIYYVSSKNNRADTSPRSPFKEIR